MQGGSEAHSVSPSVLMMREKAEKLRAEIEASTFKEANHTKYVPPKASSSPLSGLSKSVLIRTDVDILSELSFVKRENEMLHSEIEKLNNEIEKLKRDEQRRIESYARREDSFVKEIDSLRAQLNQRTLELSTTAPSESYLYHQQRRILAIIDEFQVRESSLESELESRRIELFKARLAAVRVEIEAREQTGMATLVANQRIDNLAKQLNWIKNEALELSLRNQRLVKENKELKMGKIMDLNALSASHKEKSQKMQRNNSPTPIPSKSKKSSHENLLHEPSEKVKKSHSQLDSFLSEKDMPRSTSFIAPKQIEVIDDTFGEENHLDTMIQNFYDGLKKAEEVLQIDQPISTENVNNNNSTNNNTYNLNIDNSNSNSNNNNNNNNSTQRNFSSDTKSPSLSHINSDNVNSYTNRSNNIEEIGNSKTEFSNRSASLMRQITSVSVNTKFVKAMEDSKKIRLKTPPLKTNITPEKTQSKSTSQQPKQSQTNSYSSTRTEEKSAEDDFLSSDITLEMLRSLPPSQPRKEYQKRAPSSATRMRSNGEWPWLRRPNSSQSTSSNFFITSPPSSNSLTRPTTATSKHGLEDSVEKYLWAKQSK
eukprot:TRINITY_DN4904_c0_g1_i2.p1 TRINITY_DN4904_c0_g1~~TRINITY_DN4904_c0_g1_i2.p1  ORF type:complete len:596 (-),score=148.96 TRINITY_DN4904_c0_g1_i2:124-1911(-)